MALPSGGNQGNETRDKNPAEEAKRAQTSRLGTDGGVNPTEQDKQEEQRKQEKEKDIQTSGWANMKGSDKPGQESTSHLKMEGKEDPTQKSEGKPKDAGLEKQMEDGDKKPEQVKQERKNNQTLSWGKAQKAVGPDEGGDKKGKGGPSSTEKLPSSAELNEILRKNKTAEGEKNTHPVESKADRNQKLRDIVFPNPKAALDKIARNAAFDQKLKDIGYVRTDKAPGNRRLSEKETKKLFHEKVQQGKQAGGDNFLGDAAKNVTNGEKTPGAAGRQEKTEGKDDPTRKPGGKPKDEGQGMLMEAGDKKPEQGTQMAKQEGKNDQTFAWGKAYKAFGAEEGGEEKRKGGPSSTEKLPSSAELNEILRNNKPDGDKPTRSINRDADINKNLIDMALGNSRATLDKINREAEFDRKLKDIGYVRTDKSPDTRRPSGEKTPGSAGMQELPGESGEKKLVNEGKSGKDLLRAFVQQSKKQVKETNPLDELQGKSLGEKGEATNPVDQFNLDTKQVGKGLDKFEAENPGKIKEAYGAEFVKEVSGLKWVDEQVADFKKKGQGAEDKLMKLSNLPGMLEGKAADMADSIDSQPASPDGKKGGSDHTVRSRSYFIGLMSSDITDSVRNSQDQVDRAAICYGMAAAAFSVVADLGNLRTSTAEGGGIFSRRAFQDNMRAPDDIAARITTLEDSSGDPERVRTGLARGIEIARSSLNKALIFAGDDPKVRRGAINLAAGALDSVALKVLVQDAGYDISFISEGGGKSKEGQQPDSTSERERTKDQPAPKELSGKEKRSRSTVFPQVDDLGSERKNALQKELDDNSPPKKLAEVFGGPMYSKDHGRIMDKNDKPIRREQKSGAAMPADQQAGEAEKDHVRLLKNAQFFGSGDNRLESAFAYGLAASAFTIAGAPDAALTSANYLGERKFLDSVRTPPSVEKCIRSLLTDSPEYGEGMKSVVRVGVQAARHVITNALERAGSDPADREKALSAAAGLLNSTAREILGNMEKRAGKGGEIPPGPPDSGEKPQPGRIPESSPGDHARPSKPLPAGPEEITGQVDSPQPAGRGASPVAAHSPQEDLDDHDQPREALPAGPEEITNRMESREGKRGTDPSKEDLPMEFLNDQVKGVVGKGGKDNYTPGRLENILGKDAIPVLSDHVLEGEQFTEGQSSGKQKDKTGEGPDKGTITWKIGLIHSDVVDDIRRSQDPDERAAVCAGVSLAAFSTYIGLAEMKKDILGAGKDFTPSDFHARMQVPRDVAGRVRTALENGVPRERVNSGVLRGIEIARRTINTALEIAGSDPAKRRHALVECAQTLSAAALKVSGEDSGRDMSVKK